MEWKRRGGARGIEWGRGTKRTVVVSQDEFEYAVQAKEV